MFASILLGYLEGSRHASNNMFTSQPFVNECTECSRLSRETGKWQLSTNVTSRTADTGAIVLWNTPGKDSRIRCAQMSVAPLCRMAVARMERQVDARERMS